ncbi:MAG: hypothetical protein ACXABC_06565 [Candidatus Thorarchaeota archaeon]
MDWKRSEHEVIALKIIAEYTITQSFNHQEVVFKKNRMIRNLIILDTRGRPHLCANFGECHSLSDDTEEVSGFLSALCSFVKILSSDGLDRIQLGGLRFMLKSRQDLIFAISADDEDTKKHKSALSKIVELFFDIYDSLLLGINEEIDTEVFQDFPKYLVDHDILKLNCGEYVECKGCPNRDNSLSLREMIDELDSGLDV